MPNERFIAAMTAMQQIADQVAIITKGNKSYTMVKDRIEVFRKELGDEYGIDTTVHYKSFDHGEPVVAIAKIIKGDKVIASGHAVEFIGSSKMTEASPIEIAETSAIGRALACFGLAGGEYASQFEMEAHARKEVFVGNGPTQQNGPRGNVPPPIQRDAQQGEQETEFWLPPDDDSTWLQPDLTLNNIIAQVEQIESAAGLSRYWSDLKGFVGAIKQESPDMLAEIKAAFATQHNTLAGGKH